MRNICVYCGSQSGHDSRYQQAAEALGQLLAERHYGLVYGGGERGLMGAIAHAVLTHGGEVNGVIPEAMVEREWTSQQPTRLHVEATMHDRKARMAELADAFIAMPGGYGTLEELFEIITWAQLGIHQKPIGLLNIDGYFDALVMLIERAIHDGFIREEHQHFWVIADEPAVLLDQLTQHTMPFVRPWSDRGASDGIV